MPLHPDAADTQGKRVVVKIDSRPGRQHEEMLAQYEESIKVTRQAALDAAESDSVITASGKCLRRRAGMVSSCLHRQLKRLFESL